MCGYMGCGACIFGSTMKGIPVLGSNPYVCIVGCCGCCICWCGGGGGGGGWDCSDVDEFVEEAAPKLPGVNVLALALNEKDLALALSFDVTLGVFFTSL